MCHEVGGAQETALLGTFRRTSINREPISIHDLSAHTRPPHPHLCLLLLGPPELEMHWVPH